MLEACFLYFTWIVILLVSTQRTAAQSLEDIAFSNLNFNNILNPTWDAQVRKVCSDAAVAAQPSLSTGGLIVCYNVAAVQPSTGLFLGDLRLYIAGRSTLSTHAAIQTKIDFANVAVIRNTTESQGSTVSTFSKRDLQEDSTAISHIYARSPIAQNLEVGALPLTNSIRPGSQAGIASPQQGIKPILATARLGESITSPAILPGERRLTVLRRSKALAAFPTSFVSTMLNSSTLFSANTGAQISGTQLQTIQFLGMVNVDVASSNPDGTGVLGALLPTMSFVVSVPGQANTTIGMNSFVRAFLTGVQSKAKPAGTFVLPGRIFGGADKSVSLIGMYIVPAYTAVMLVTLFSGVVTRWNLRRLHRARVRKS